MNHKRSLTHRLVLLALALIIASVAMAAIEHIQTTQSHGSPRAQPRCVDLPCYDDSDCGSLCSCDRPPNAQVGTCIACE